MKKPFLRNSLGENVCCGSVRGQIFFGNSIKSKLFYGVEVVVDFLLQNVQLLSSLCPYNCIFCVWFVE